jgi:phosphoribosyl 1,2-cyclic phosphodiesterase
MTNSPFTVRFWGVRGSLAAGGPDFAAVGGNTTCIEVRAGGELIILDAGTGLFPLGQALSQPAKATLLLTHFHWDHIQGFPLFGPAYRPENAFTVYGPAERGADVKAVFSRQMEPPHFPVTLTSLRARIEFRSVRASEEFAIGPVRVRTVALNHPQSCLGYRISLGGASVVLATDTEPREDSAVDPAVVELARGADLLIHDAQYTEQEYDGRSGPPRKGWGHSTYDVACSVARAAGVKQLALFHHDPSHTDRYIERIVIGARALFPRSMLAREGMVLDVNSTGQRGPLTIKGNSRDSRASSLHAA